MKETVCGLILAQAPYFFKEQHLEWHCPCPTPFYGPHSTNHYLSLLKNVFHVFTLLKCKPCKERAFVLLNSVTPVGTSYVICRTQRKMETLGPVFKNY